MENYHPESLKKTKNACLFHTLSFETPFMILINLRVEGPIKEQSLFEFGVDTPHIQFTFYYSEPELYKWIDFFTQHSGTRLSECLSGGKTRLI